MKIYFDNNHQPEQKKIFLGTPYKKIICALNGIDEDSFSITPNINNTFELTFDVNRYILKNGKELESNGYNLFDIYMRLYVEDIGWFIMQSPQITNNGTKEIKSIIAQSSEIEMQQHDLKGLKINKGTTDSYEMLVDGNVEMVGDVEFAKEQIKFHNKLKPELSFLNILMDVSGLKGWSVGYIDTTPKIYKYYDNGELKEKQVMLEDEIGSFDIESQDLYSFLTQDAAQYFNCVFIFDFKEFKINAYRPEHFGKDTNINIGFRNLQQSNEISVDENNIFTRYYVQGSDDLGITYVNFGTNIIENLSYFLNEKYLSSDLIKKYKLWSDDIELKRPLYIENTRLYNKQMSVITELHNRLPLDDCSTDWSTFEDDKLLEAKSNYEAQKKGYETFYVDEDGNFDEDALKASPDANDYYQIKDVILPSIEIEIENRKIIDNKDPDDYVESYKTNWKLYGLDELEVKLSTYKNTKKLAEDQKCTLPYTDDSGHTQDFHDELYTKYLDAVNQLDPNFIGSCAEAISQRTSEIEIATILQKQYDAERKNIARYVDKSTWEYKTGDSSEIVSFTEKDLYCLSKLYINGDYSNENMFLTDSDDSISAIDEQLKLLDVAKEDLDIASQPQYTYTTNLDNFIAKYEYKNYTDNLNVGDFIYLGVRDDYVVKLRIMSITCNLLKMDNNLQITFSNMLKSRAGRNDLAYLVGSSTSGRKNTSSGSSNGFLSNEGITITSGLLQKLLSSGAFSDKVSQLVYKEFAGYIGKTISVNELNAKIIKVVDIEGANGFFEYLQTKLISAGKIVAGSGEFKELDTLVAKIKNAIIGSSSTETGIIVRLTADNAVIDEAFIKEVISEYISVNELKAGNISTNKFSIKSEDGSLSIVGNTQQFKDKDDNVRIQIGEDESGNFTFIVYDSTGTGILLDQEGIHESAISDGLIKNDMIADNTIGKEKVNWSDAGASVDKNGNPVWNSAQITIDGSGLDVKFSSILSLIEGIEERTDSLEKQFASIDLTGEQIFIEKDGVITPNIISVYANCKGNAVIDKWFIDDVENFECVSNDKNTIVIPSTYIRNKNTIIIKAQNADGSIYDIFTISKILDGNAVDPYTVILTNESILFSVDSNGYPTTDQSYNCNVLVYRGIEKVTKFTVGEVVGDSGITITKENNTITLYADPNTCITSNSGEYTVKVTVDGATFERPISWVTFKAVEGEYSGSFTSSDGLIFDKSKLTESDITTLKTHVYYNSVELDDSLYKVEWYQSKDNGIVELISTSHTITINLNDFNTSNDIYFLFELYDKKLITEEGVLLTSENGYALLCS